MELCPTCKGSFSLFGFARMENGECKPMTIKCYVCDGAGVITKEHLKRIEVGKRMRENRLKRDMSLREEAKRLGISAVQLSNMENGR